jgi:hypothetical protein
MLIFSRQAIRAPLALSALRIFFFVFLLLALAAQACHAYDNSATDAYPYWRQWQKEFHGCGGLVIRGEDKGKKLWGILQNRHVPDEWYVVKDRKYKKRDVKVERGCKPGMSPP